MPDPKSTPARIANGPQIMCRNCGEISNHMTGLCRECRGVAAIAAGTLTKADRLYAEWKDQQRGKQS